MTARAWPDRGRWRELDLRWARAINAAARQPACGLVCRTASRLGDGLFWYVLMATLPLLQGEAGWRASSRMLVAGGVALTLYLVLKQSIGRPRPCDSCVDILVLCRALDRFSFPSGHALHAVTFTLVLADDFPRLALGLSPLTCLIAVSRIVVGLHYPSDVLAGVLLGVVVASAVSAFGGAIG